MAIDWLDRLSKPLDAVEHGVDAAAVTFATQHTGPLTFDRIDYPAAQTVYEDFGRTGASEWEHRIRVVMYFDFSRGTGMTEDILHPVAAVIDEVLTELGTVGCVTNYRPETIDFFSGEPNNSLVLAVSIQFAVETLLDPADF